MNQVHADQTESSAQSRVRKHVSDPNLAEKYLSQGYRIINVWRPINGTVESSPWAFTSAATTEEENFVTFQHRYPTFNGEIMGVKYNPKAEWKFCAGVNDNERILLKCFDSQDGVG